MNVPQSGLIPLKISLKKLFSVFQLMVFLEMVGLIFDEDLPVELKPLTL